MDRGYSDKTHALIERMSAVAMRQEYVFDKRLIRKLVRRSYEMFGLDVPKIIWCVDIFDEKFVMNASNAMNASNVRNASNASNAWNARNASNAWNAMNASNARNASNAWNAMNASNARNARNASNVRNASNAYWSAVDLDFDECVFIHEYIQTNEPNENDLKAVEAQALFLQCKEAGVGYWAEWDGTLAVCPNPRVKLNAQGRHHCETGPAISWKGGHSFYFLNGAEVPEYIVMTPANELDPKCLVTETNVEVRQELIKKIGIERCLAALDVECVDSDAMYELYKFTLGEIDRTYLKMLNPSTFEHHFEGVPNGCATIDEALIFRNGGHKRKFSNDEGAVEWMQQGDVLFFPKLKQGQTHYKVRPKVLT